jgi:hypothetical protein
MREGEGAGAMMSGPLVSGNSQTATPFPFPFIVLDVRVTFFYFQTPLTSTSTLVAFQFQPCRLSFSNPRHFSISSPSP